MTTLNIENGEVMLVHGNSFLPKAIQFFMNLNRWLRLDFKPFYKEVANHTGIGIGNNQVFEAVAKGNKSLDINSHYYSKKGYVIKIYNLDLNSEQLFRLKTLCGLYKDIPYQYSNFIVWIVNILTLGFVWIGRTGTDASKEMFCSETTATTLFYITSPDTTVYSPHNKIHNKLRKFWRVSPYDIQKICEKYGTLKNTYIIE